MIKGEEIDLKKYEIPFEKHWELSKLETFRTWILYYVNELKLNTRDELVRELERTFKPKYVPVLTEFKFSLGKGAISGNHSTLLLISCSKMIS